MSCALCKKDHELRNSHIIPEWVFSDLYDSKHRYNVLATFESPPRAHEQKGLREKLLCDECEQKFSRYERYARGVVKGGVALTATRYPERIEVSDVNYEIFKLFQMSILWRASIAKHRMFSRVKLGPHEEKLRLMLLNENPGRKSDYPCLMFGITSENKPIPNLIDQPTLIRIDGQKCYQFIFSGLIWVYFVANHAPNMIIQQHVLSENGRLVIWIKRFEELGHLKNFASTLHTMGRFEKPYSD